MKIVFFIKCLKGISVFSRVSNQVLVVFGGNSSIVASVVCTVIQFIDDLF